jgi:SNF2 family DNA or RNA helicase
VLFRALRNLCLTLLKQFRFINTISDVYQAEEPPQFRGGIIADPMGLGKTLTMVALIATDLDTDRDSGITDDGGDHDKSYASATLIIVPPPRKTYILFQSMAIQPTNFH